MILKRVEGGGQWELPIDEVVYGYKASAQARSGDPPSKALPRYLEYPSGLFSKTSKADLRALLLAVQAVGFAHAEPGRCACGRRMWRSLGRGSFHIVEPCELLPAYDEHGEKLVMERT